MKVLFPLLIVVVLAIFGGQADEIGDPCPQGWLHFDGSCYRYFGNRVSWDTALNRCRDHYSTNGRADLVSIHNRQENAFTYDLFRDAAGITPDYKGSLPLYGAWIGFHQETVGSTGPFVWSDGTSAEEFTSWFPGEPNNSGRAGDEDCAHFWRRNAADDTNVSWNDSSCGIALPYICKVAPNYY